MAIIWALAFEELILAIILGYLASGALGICIGLVVWSLVIAFLTPIKVVAVNFITNPVFELMKQQVINRAKKKVEGIRPKIVAIAGSFGKTTTKHFVFDLVRYNYKTQLIPGTINTPLGIANWINSSLETSTQLLIVEMDTYKAGEIDLCCYMTKPDIAILTNIGDQHLERLGTQNALKMALIEVFKNTGKDGYCVTDRETFTILPETHKTRNITIISDEDAIYKQTKLDVTHLSITAKHNLKYALVVAEQLDIPLSFVSDSIKKLELPDRRHRPSSFYGFESIDDSYNISFSTAVAGINDAAMQAEQKKKKLLIITAGIPELGEENKDSNIKLGQLIAEKAAKVIVLQSILAQEVEEGIKSAQSKCELIRAQDFAAAVEKVKAMNPDEIFVLVQPELTDLYY